MTRSPIEVKIIGSGIGFPSVTVSNTNSDLSKVMSNKKKEMVPCKEEEKEMGPPKEKDKETSPSKALAFASCAIVCTAALAQGVLLCWWNPVLPQVTFT